MKHKSSPRLRFTGAVLLLAALIFLVPALRGGDRTLYLLAVVFPCAILLCETLLARMFSLDRLILTLCLWLCAAGTAALAVTDPVAAWAQTLRCGAGLAALLAGGILIRSLSSSLLTAVCSAFLGLLVLATRLLAPDFTLPLSEAGLALLLIAFAALLTRQGPISAAVAAAAALVLLLLCGETAEALFWGLTVLLLFFAADGRLIVVLPALAIVLAFFFGAIRLIPVTPAADQTSLAALVSAGAVGTETLPESLTSLGTGSLFYRLTGHYGLLFSGLTVLLILPLLLRGTTVASSARTRFHAVLAMGVCLLLGLRTLAALLSAFGILPLAVQPVPFLTDSLPSLCAQMFLAGILCGISGRNDADLAEDAHLAMLAK